MLFVYVSVFFFFNDTATTEIYTRSIVGSVRCVQETVSVHPAFGKISGQLEPVGLGPGNDHDTGSILIQPVHDTGPLLIHGADIGGDVRPLMQQEIDQGRPRLARRWMRGHPCGLVDHQDMIVLIERRQIAGYRLGRIVPGLRLGRPDGQGLASEELVFALGDRDPVDPGKPPFNPVLDPPPGNAFLGQFSAPEFIQAQTDIGHGDGPFPKRYMFFLHHGVATIPGTIEKQNSI
eukprot:TRINITY_DN32034_c0_g2_i1.p1 TRINITY_DN32034_c0_g2~~TRINITY_DN32034_c0_g2_i1.p1  ORF type:complete len:234 (+),score=66.01 TRINITY_DN32034_c0_g2_i1:64-765(+)